MLTAPGTKAIREPQKVLLVDRIEHLHHGPLDNLIFQRSDPKRPLSIPFRYELPSPGQSSIGATMNARMQIHQPSFEVLLILLPREPIHSRSCVPLEYGERCPQQINVYMMNQSREPLLLPLSCSLSYTFKSRKHALPARCPARASLARVPLGPLPWLHRLRLRSSGVVRRLPRYFGGV
jgi:hypothetical protein